MKQLYILLLLLVSFEFNSQTTIATTYTPAVAFNSGLTFNVNNTNSYTIRLRGFNYGNGSFATAPNFNNIVQVWYKASAINGAPGAISNANGWTLAGQKTFNGEETVFVDFFKQLNIDIPAGQTFGIYVASNFNIAGFTIGAGVRDTFSSNGVNLITGNLISYAGASTGPATTQAGYTQYLVFDVPSICTGKPTAGKITGLSGFCNAATANNRFFMLENYTNALGLTFQWQSSTTINGVYTNLGTNSIVLNNNVAGNRYYRCIVTCTNSTLKDTTPIFGDTLKSNFHCGYCTITGNNIDDTKIDSVQFLNTAIGSSATNCEVYTDNRNLIPSKIRAGGNFNVKVFNGSCTGNFFTFVGALFFDFNRNATFDATDRVGTFGPMAATGGQVINTNISVPWNNQEGVTGLRIILNEGTIPPVSACTTFGWGEAEDYLVEITRDSIDVRMNGIDSNYNGCSLSNVPIKFSASNAGIKTLITPSFSYSVNGSAPVTETFSNINKDATNFYTFTTLFSPTTFGAQTLTIWSNNITDTFKGNDTLRFIFYNFPTPPTPVADDDTVCIGSPQTIFRASSSSPFMTRWYTDAAGTNEVSTGNQYVINNPTGNNTVYAKSIYSYTTNFGPTTTNPEVLVAAANQGLIFDVQRNKVKINYVTMKFNSTGIGAIEIRTSGGALLFTKSFIATTAGSMMIIPIGYELPIGTGYRILLSTNPGLTVARGSFTAFPQQIPNVIRITGSTTANQYNMFFDWNVTYDACESPLIPVKSVYINSTASPSKALFKDTFFCQYPDAYLDAKNAGSTYKWQDNSTNQKIKVTNSGLYIVTITNSVGCNIVDTSKVEVRVSPIFSLGNDTTICAGKSAILKSGFTNRGYNHVWSNGDLDPETEVRSAGTYSVNVFNTNSNCGYSDTVVVNVVPSPNAFLGRDTFACNNAPININAPTNANYQYVWDNGLTNSFRTVSAKGVTKAWVEITDISNAYGCKASDTVLVTIARLVKPNLGLDKVSCNVTETIGVPDSAHLGYRWNSGETTSSISKSAAGTYILTVTEVNTTCSFSDTIKLSFIPTPPLDLGSDIFTCKKTPITLKANAGWTTYLWSNSFNTQSITVGAVTNSYSVTATNSCGTATDNISITVQDTVLGFNLPNDTTICSPLTLNVPLQPLGNKIQWSTSEVSPSITITNSGVYWVSISNECGAKSDAIRVIKDTLPTPDFNTTQSGTFVSFTNRSINGVSYRWQFGDDSTSTAKNPTHYYLNKGTYSVKLIATNSCGDTVSRTKSIILYNSSISSVTHEAISVYPNPTSDKFIIQTNSISRDAYMVDLMTIDGRIIKNQESKFNSTNEIELQVNEISAGTYWLRLTDKDQNQILKKVSITR